MSESLRDIAVPAGEESNPHIRVQQLAAAVCDIGGVVRAARKMRGLTIKKAAESADISVGYYSQVEKNAKQPSLVILSQIATGLGIHPGLLLLLAYPLSAEPDHHTVQTLRAVYKFQKEGPCDTK